MKFLFSIVILLSVCTMSFGQGWGHGHGRGHGHGHGYGQYQKSFGSHPGQNPYYDYGRRNTYPSVQPYTLHRPDGTAVRKYRYHSNYNAYRYYTPRYYRSPYRVYVAPRGVIGHMFDYMYIP